MDKKRRNKPQKPETTEPEIREPEASEAVEQETEPPAAPAAETVEQETPAVPTAEAGKRGWYEKGILIAIAAILLLLILLLLGRFLRKGAAPDGEGPVPSEQRDVLLAYAPSFGADEDVLSTLSDAAAQLYEDILAASEKNRAYLLSWDPDGHAWQAASLSDDALFSGLPETAASLPEGEGCLDDALRFAKAWAETDTRKGAETGVILLTDRAPADSTGAGQTGGGDGPYDEMDTADYAAANAAYDAAADLSLDTPLTVLAATAGQTGDTLNFTRRFCGDIQTAGFYEIPDAAGLAGLRRTIAQELLSESGTRKLSFRYPQDHDYSAVCYYTDQYFADSAYTYNQSLATMTMSLAMSAFASEDQPRYADKSANVRALLKSIGVRDADVGTNQWFTVRPETDSIAVAAGSKQITVNGETYTLIAAAIRGRGYGREWASNFTIGETGLHKGFADARDKVLDYLKTYIADRGITGPVKFWVTGFSRAAATANLVSGALDDGVDFGEGVTYSPEDVYAYCFEPPAGALVEEVRGQERYYNIFNIVNQSDPVPYVAPSPLGFWRYGIDRYLPSAQSSSNYLTERAAMLRIYNAMDSTGRYGVDDFHMKKLNPAGLLNRDKSGVVEDDVQNNYSQGVYLTNYVSLIAKEYIQNRVNYVERYESEIREVCSILYGCTEAQQAALMEALKQRIQAHWGEAVIALLNPLGDRADAYALVSDWLVEAANEAGVEEYDEAMLRSAGAALSDLLLNLVSQHPNYAATLTANLGGMGEAHFPELCYAWMASMDDNYKRGAEASFNNGNYRIVRVNCDVDVEVRDEDGVVVAEITDDIPQDIRGSSILSGVNNNGEKIVILPFDSAYTITVSGRDGDTAALQEAGTAAETVSVGIDEYTAAAGDITRGVDYENLSLAPGEILTGVLPGRESDFSGAVTEVPTQYILTASTGAAIASDADLSGEQAGTLYTVTLGSANESTGLALGGGPARYGDFVRAEAVPAEGFAFAGWYTGSFQSTVLPEADPVSTEAVYRFAVTEDTALTACFVSAPDSGGASMGTGDDTEGTYPFHDVLPGSYCYDAVRWASSNGIAAGTSTYEFSPGLPCTAAQAVTFLWRAAGSPAPSLLEPPFPDVDPEAYYYDAVCWAAERDIALGTAEGIFDPDRTVTRAQFITLFYRSFGQGVRLADNPFRDVAENAYCRDAAAWAWKEGITKGTTSDTFSPSMLCSRGQAAAFLYRYFA
ncbi:MAG: S-layer homology domain-containing protein [Oscillibacter sp.]|nr:S-layer homology domain-containing protein [Oscillibacter sp.]